MHKWLLLLCLPVVCISCATPQYYILPGAPPVAQTPPPTADVAPLPPLSPPPLAPPPPPTGTVEKTSPPRGPQVVAPLHYAIPAPPAPPSAVAAALPTRRKAVKHPHVVRRGRVVYTGSKTTKPATHLTGKPATKKTKP